MGVKGGAAPHPQLRRGELLELKWEDIDLEQGTIQVRRQVARIGGKVVEAPLKMKNSYRNVSIYSTGC